MTEAQGIKVPPKKNWIIAPGFGEADIKPPKRVSRLPSEGLTPKKKPGEGRRP